jgi:Flp pilus assembly protein TadD
MLGELDLVAGEPERAIADLKAGLALAPRDPELLARLARAELLADRVSDAERTLAVPRDSDTASILIAEGEAARRDGRDRAAIAAFERATRIAPDDDRAWFALGRAQGEREDSVPARRNLERALKLNPLGPGYEGELGTVDTFANRFADAQAAFDAALKDTPGDYVALTGLGLLRLKRGNPEAHSRRCCAPASWSRATHGRRSIPALPITSSAGTPTRSRRLNQASELDDKDPLPYMLLTQVYTDLFRAGDAVDASREALKRLPYLKSLNQIANDQQGKANLGYSLAFFGLEDWALELAQDSTTRSPVRVTCSSPTATRANTTRTPSCSRGS